MIPSVLSVIADLLSKKEVNSLLAECSDWRDVIASAARLKRLTPEDLCKRVASIIELPFSDSLPTCDLNAVGYSPDELRAYGCIPIVNSDGKILFAATDPIRVLKLAPDVKKSQISLALWSTIDAALIQSEAAYRKDSDSDGLLRGILELLIREVESFKESRALIDFSGDDVAYEFLTDRACKAKGSIAAQVKEPLLNFVERFANRDSKLLLGEKLEIKLSVSLVDNELKRYMLSWERTSEMLQLTEIEGPRLSDRETENRRKLLVVEDNPAFAEVLKQYFEKRGFAVTLAFGGEQAKEILKSPDAYDCVICDLHMPRFNGLDLLGELRSSDTRSRLPFLLLTSDDQVESQLAALEKGADGYITKQQDPRLIFAHVNRLLSREGEWRSAC